jgi:hypothetical protein
MERRRGEIRTYAAVEKRSASLSQSATRFHLGNIWATISKLLILKGCDRPTKPSIEPALARAERSHVCDHLIGGDQEAAALAAARGVGA